ncbi:choice-of-anchor P family protein [Saccharopolyspora soli]|uniref:choice-of-anchor P family protein n=1 Tax=Saccharopolyspora soli TaxID=2926618 RepID=UPI001F596FE3|nr:choice-of-anchor P family protein [Saccharopolyspora soli]
MTALFMASSALAAQGAEDATSSAFGISATGPVTIEPTPAVTSSDEKKQRSVATVAAPAGSISAQALNAKATQDTSSSSVVDLQVQAAQLTASAVRAECSDGEGTASIANVQLAGETLDASPPPNTEISVPGGGTLVLNKQTENADGSLTVTAVHLVVEGTQTIEVASATCGQPVGETTPPPPPGDGGETPQPPPADAPRPTPVPGHLPVTH